MICAPVQRALVNIGMATAALDHSIGSMGLLVDVIQAALVALATPADADMLLDVLRASLSMPADAPSNQGSQAASAGETNLQNEPL